MRLKRKNIIEKLGKLSKDDIKEIAMKVASGFVTYKVNIKYEDEINKAYFDLWNADSTAPRVTYVKEKKIVEKLGNLSKADIKEIAMKVALESDIVYKVNIKYRDEINKAHFDLWNADSTAPRVTYVKENKIVKKHGELSKFDIKEIAMSVDPGLGITYKVSIIYKKEIDKAYQDLWGGDSPAPGITYVEENRDIVEPSGVDSFFSSSLFDFE